MKKCLVCGKEFKPCNTCAKGDINFSWRKVVCCPEHFRYHVPIIEYVRGKITKKEAKAELTRAINDFGQLEFSDNIKNIVKEIMAEEKKSKKSKSLIDDYVQSEEKISVVNTEESNFNSEKIIEINSDELSVENNIAFINE